MRDLFSNPIAQRKVRIGVTAYKYPNGVINIEGTKYVLYSMKSAISQWRKNNPIRKNIVGKK